MHKLTHSDGLQEAVRFVFHFLVIFGLFVVPTLFVEAITSMLGLS
jgi:hypothetical protein